MNKLILMLTIVLMLSSCEEPKAEKVFNSPCGKYTLEVYPKKVRWSAPGDSGQGPGRVVLRSRENGILKEVAVDMVNLVEKVWWESDSVTVRGLDTWDLKY